MGVHCRLFLFIISASCLHSYGDDYTSKIAFPSDIYSTLEAEVMVRHTHTNNFQTNCIVTTPDSTRHNFTTSVMDEPQIMSDKKVTFWGRSSEANDCGVRIRNISADDFGKWLLTSENAEETSITQSFSIHYTDIINQDKNETVKVGDPFTLKVTDKKFNYCQIMKPEGKPFYQVFNGTCAATLMTATYADLGTWNISVGVQGRVEEIIIKHILTADDWILSAGIVPSNSTNKNAVNLHCNLQHSNMDVKGCRFIRPTDKVGFFLQPGMSNGYYSYYGSGLNNKECGLTIEHPDELDYGQWQCILIVEQNGVKNTVGTILSFKEPDKIQMLEMRSAPLSVMRESNGSITCQIDSPLLYCTIISPQGERFAGDQNDLGLGVCSLPVTNFTEKHSGKWMCNMGQVGGSDLQTSVLVKILDSPLSAVEPSVIGNIGQSAVLNCKVITRTPSLSYCRFIRPDGTGFNLNTTFEVVQGLYEYYGEGLAVGHCGLHIKYLSLNDEGLWKCAVVSKFYVGELSAFITVKVTGSTNVFPSSLTITQNEDVILRLNGLHQEQKQCTVTMPNNTIVDLSYPGIYNVSYWGIGLQEGDCGVRISRQAFQTQSSEYKMWILTSVGPKGVLANGTGWIAVSGQPEIQRQALTILEVNFGTKIDLNCTKEGSEYCIMVPPRQNANKFKPGSCSVAIDALTSAYLGNWTCIFGMKGSTEEVIETTVLTVKDPGLSVGLTTTTYPHNMLVNLYCNADKQLGFCRFVSPNETVFVLSEGLVTGRYSFWGNGLDVGHCGISITDPQQEDFGLWKCFVGIKSDDDIQISGGYLIISNNEEIIPWVSPHEDVFVINGSQLTIICLAETSLTYCWLQHPNGTQFASIPHKNGTGYYYAGQGLEMGECGITVLAAQLTDSGKWTCHMGAESTSGEELVAIVNVMITENVIMSNSTNFEVQNNEMVIIGCQSIPVGTQLEYCRFVRPDDTPINPDHETGKGVLDRYWYYGSGLDHGQCGLLIQGVEEVDFGEWTCAVRLQGEVKEEHQTITIQTESNINIALIIGLAVGALVIIVGVSILGVKLRKHKHNTVEEAVGLSDLTQARQSDASSSNDSEVIYEEQQL